MTINELIERLEEYRDDVCGDAEVRLMTQQHWPFENRIAGLASGSELEGTQLCYGSKRAGEVAR